MSFVSDESIHPSPDDDDRRLHSQQMRLAGVNNCDEHETMQTHTINKNTNIKIEGNEKDHRKESKDSQTTGSGHSSLLSSVLGLTGRLIASHLGNSSHPYNASVQQTHSPHQWKQILAEWQCEENKIPEHVTIPRLTNTNWETANDENSEDEKRILAHTGQVMQRLIQVATQAGINSKHPGHFSFVCGGGIHPPLLADMVTQLLNAFTGFTLPGPGLVQLEQHVIDWMTKEFGMRETAGGIFTSGATLSHHAAIMVARDIRLLSGERNSPSATPLTPPGRSRGDLLSNATLYCSVETHCSVFKAWRMAGFGLSNIRLLPVSPIDHSLDCSELQCAIDADRLNGLLPFCIVANAGTTSSGAVDDFNKIAQCAEENNIWLHADAAYGHHKPTQPGKNCSCGWELIRLCHCSISLGGFFYLTASGKRTLSGLSRCDSICLDAHKTLFMPFGTGMLLVQDQKWLKDAFAIPEHLQPYVRKMFVPSPISAGEQMEEHHHLDVPQFHKATPSPSPMSEESNYLESPVPRSPIPVQSPSPIPMLAEPPTTVPIVVPPSLNPSSIAPAGGALWASNFSQITPEYTRPCRGIRIWLSFQLLGVDAFRAELDSKLQMTTWLKERIVAEFGSDGAQAENVHTNGGAVHVNPSRGYALPDGKRFFLAVQNDPKLSVLTWRIQVVSSQVLSVDSIVPQDFSAWEDALTAHMCESVMSFGRSLLYPTQLSGRTVARVCLLSPYHSHASCNALIADLHAACARIQTWFAENGNEKNNAE